MLNLTSAPNPSYRYTQFRFGTEAAERILGNLGVELDDAKAFGERVRRSLEQHEVETEDSEPLEIFV
jgi:hypothetical protein